MKRNTLIHHPVLGYLDGYDAKICEWTPDPKKAWAMTQEEAARRLLVIQKRYQHARTIPLLAAQPHESVRRFWKPKREEVSEQCASCPFREGNDAAFGGIMRKLYKQFELDPPTPAEISASRECVKRELEHSGDFVCHLTAYNPDMSLKDGCEHRQCAGATKWWKEGGDFGLK